MWTDNEVNLEEFQQEYLVTTILYWDDDTTLKLHRNAGLKPKDEPLPADNDFVDDIQYIASRIDHQTVSKLAAKGREGLQLPSHPSLRRGYRLLPIKGCTYGQVLILMLCPG